MDPISVAGSVVTLISPFLPYLVQLGKSVEKKLEDVIAEQGGQLVWNTAQSLWGKISARFKTDDEVQSAAKTTAAKPADQTRQEILAEVLAERLKESPDLVQELVQAMGGQQRLQQVAAGNSAFIQRVQQKMASAGTQQVKAGDNSSITDIIQDMG